MFSDFNAKYFSPEKYQQALRETEEAAGDPCVRLCETPVFIDKAYADTVVKGALEITQQVLNLDMPVPALFHMPSAPKRPNFFIVDFAMTKAGPKLIELQGFPSNVLFAPMLADIYKHAYGLPDRLQSLFCSMEDIRMTVMGRHDAENVVLMEINPWQQPSRRDFVLTQKKFGIAVVDIKDIIKKGRALYYLKDGVEKRIRRIYNRVVPGEYMSLDLDENAPFLFSDDLDVEWAGDPSWFMRVSKYALPRLRHPMVPFSIMLDQLPVFPMDLENYVLKPAFLNAGIGVKLDITEADLNAIHPAKRGQYLFMEKVTYDPFIPDLNGGKVSAELRVMFIWPDEAEDPLLSSFSARVMHGNNVNANLWGQDTWCGFAPVFVF